MKSKDHGTITQDELKKLIKYDPDTGIVTWLNDSKPLGFFSNGYLRLYLKKRIYAVHRLIWLYVHGRFPEDVLDHINGIKDDNRLTNLREASEGQNMHARKLTRNNASGFKGVYFKPRKGNWEAYITHNNKQKRLADSIPLKRRHMHTTKRPFDFTANSQC